MTLQPAISPESTLPALTDEEYVRYRDFVHEQFGLFFPENRRPELERGVWQALSGSPCATPADLYQLLKDTANRGVVLERLANALTICETHFFRDEPQFNALYTQVLPEIIARRQALRTIRIWSAGCASGEEPYSIAMMLRELLDDVDNWSITILGTDINTQAIERARLGIFREWAFREERARRLQSRYFQALGDRYALIPEVRRMVTFTHMNLSEDCYPSYATNTTFMDLILCRNVTIYFDDHLTRHVMDRFFQCNIDGGWLVLGHSEPSAAANRAYQPRNFPGAVLYQKEEQAASQVTGRVPVRKVILNSIHQANTPTPRKAPVDLARKPEAVCFSAPQQLDPMEALEQARDLLSYGRSEEARDLLLPHSSSSGTSAYVAALLGKAYANLGDWPNAERWCQEAIRMDPLSIEAHYTLSLVQQHLDKLDASIESMRKVVYIDRKHVLGHFSLASLYHQKGQIPQALKALDNARAMLDELPGDLVLPDSDGVTAGRLRDGVLRLQQRWSMEG
ncbi:MAG: hypothetical protein EHM70_00070 [Chloroflexota bacterium]|nr:MAG: hypothetical protein EHM70_00070 [Chloroflexota bacterium]